MKLKIKELREENGLTQKELAAKIGNMQRNISNWENGIIEPDCTTILKLADVFNVSIDELFGREYNEFYRASGHSDIPNIFNSLSKEQLEAVAALIKSFINNY